LVTPLAPARDRREAENDPSEGPSCPPFSATKPVARHPFIQPNRDSPGARQGQQLRTSRVWLDRTQRERRRAPECSARRAAEARFSARQRVVRTSSTPHSPSRRSQPSACTGAISRPRGGSVASAPLPSEPMPTPLRDEPLRAGVPAGPHAGPGSHPPDARDSCPGTQTDLAHQHRVIDKLAMLRDPMQAFRQISGAGQSREIVLLRQTVHEPPGVVTPFVVHLC
jgi:hypothetical protein